MDAFISYSNLNELEFVGVPLHIIEEGAFRGHDNLEILRIIGGDHKLIFALNFGLPTKSLISIMVWDALPMTTSLAYPYFADFDQLELLNIGANLLNVLEADLLPEDFLRPIIGYTFSPDLQHMPHWLKTSI